MGSAAITQIDPVPPKSRNLSLPLAVHGNAWRWMMKSEWWSAFAAVALATVATAAMAEKRTVTVIKQPPRKSCVTTVFFRADGGIVPMDVKTDDAWCSGAENAPYPH